MATLGKNWLTEKHIDFEYKKYVLLAYLEQVRKDFESICLYPSLSDLVNHYRNLVSIKENKHQLQDAFPQRLHKIDEAHLQLTYERLVEDDTLMAELEAIIEYSIPQFQHQLAEGKKIYNYVEDHLRIDPVGLMPLYPDQGYLFIRNGQQDTKVFEYTITIFQQPEEKYRGIHTHYLRSYPVSVMYTSEYIKTELLRENPSLPNPATFVIESGLTFPLEETLLPIAKRVLVKRVSAGD